MSDKQITTNTNEQSLDISQLKYRLFELREQVDEIISLLHHTKQQNIVLDGFASEDDKVNEGVNSREIYGIFTGQKMRDDDGNEYAVPPNYASKSKLVEGDKLKLTISPGGSFIYKQVEQTPRERIIGELVFDETLNQWMVVVNEKPYKILKASVTFYKGSIGDGVSILVPTQGHCSWGAVDNIIPKGSVE